MWALMRWICVCCDLDTSILPYSTIYIHALYLCAQQTALLRSRTKLNEFGLGRGNTFDIISPILKAMKACNALIEYYIDMYILL